MFYKYEVCHINGEDVLYLYLSMKYEFGNEFSMENEKDLERRVKNFIVSNTIPFHGHKIYLVIDGKIVKSLNMIDIDNTMIPSKEYSYDSFVVHIRLEDQSLCEILLREYIISVLLSKYQENIPDEVYKAMAVLYNTYAYKCMKEDGFVDSNNSFAIYRPISYYRSSLADLDLLIKRLNSIICSVDCQFLQYQNHYILPFIHYSNGGETLINSNYPYLSNVKSLWDMASPYYIEIHDIPYQELSQKLGTSINKDSNITMIVENKIRIFILGDRRYTEEEFKNILQLKSVDIYLIIHNDHIRIITKGWGNAYGLSIFGSCEIAKNGGKYYQILRYYFPKVKLLKYIKELS